VAVLHKYLQTAEWSLSRHMIVSGCGFEQALGRVADAVLGGLVTAPERAIAPERVVRDERVAASALLRCVLL
jgi:hypothetical protein